MKYNNKNQLPPQLRPSPPPPPSPLNKQASLTSNIVNECVKLINAENLEIEQVKIVIKTLSCIYGLDNDDNDDNEIVTKSHECKNQNEGATDLDMSKPCPHWEFDESRFAEDTQ